MWRNSLKKSNKIKKAALRTALIFQSLARNYFVAGAAAAAESVVAGAAAESCIACC